MPSNLWPENVPRTILLEGIEQLDRGEGIPGEQVFAELKARSAQRRRRHV